MSRMFDYYNGRRVSVGRIWGESSVVLRLDTGVPKEARTLRLDSAESMDRLGWKHIVPLEDAFDWNVRWCREVPTEPSSAAEIATNRIQAFSQCLGRTGLGCSESVEHSAQ